ncbi:hypothetical protein H9P43_004967 [Blastocladiella emersonii ATCC 22665]|nr:hypothetical protein H9P43_004967 [Blastocladiella emersonii ATCC 22665]
MESQPTHHHQQQPQHMQDFEATLGDALDDVRGSGMLGGDADAVCVWLRATLIHSDRPVILAHLERLAALYGKDCFYCLAAPPENASHGVDRVLPCSGYSASNCVACCEGCAMVKGNMSPPYFWRLVSLIAAKHPQPQQLLAPPTAADRINDDKVPHVLAFTSLDKNESCFMCGRSKDALMADCFELGCSLVSKFMTVDEGRFLETECRFACWLCSARKRSIPLPVLLSHVHRLFEANFTTRLDTELGSDAALVCVAEKALELYTARPEVTPPPLATPVPRLAVYGNFGVRWSRATRRVLMAKYASFAEAEAACGFAMTVDEMTQCEKVTYLGFEFVLIDDQAEFDVLEAEPKMPAQFINECKTRLAAKNLPAIGAMGPRYDRLCDCIGCKVRRVQTAIKFKRHGYLQADVLPAMDRFRGVVKDVEAESGKQLAPPIPKLVVKTAQMPKVAPPGTLYINTKCAPPPPQPRQYLDPIITPSLLPGHPPTVSHGIRSRLLNSSSSSTTTAAAPAKAPTPTAARINKQQAQSRKENQDARPSANKRMRR